MLCKLKIGLHSNKVWVENNNNMKLMNSNQGNPKVGIHENFPSN